MIQSSTSTTSAFPLAEDRTQSHSYPSIQRSKRSAVAVLEILKPATQAPVDIGNDDLQAMPVAAMGVSTKGVFEFLDTLDSRPAQATFKVIPQKIESTGLRGIHDPGLFRMKL